MQKKQEVDLKNEKESPAQSRVELSEIPKGRRLEIQEIIGLLKSGKWYLWQYPSLRGGTTALRYFEKEDEFIRYGISNQEDSYTHIETIQNIEGFLERTQHTDGYTDYYFKSVDELHPMLASMMPLKRRAEKILDELKDDRLLFCRWGFGDYDMHLCYLDFIGWYALMKDDGAIGGLEAAHFRMTESRTIKELVNYLFKFPETLATNQVPDYIKKKKEQTLRIFNELFPKGLETGKVYFKSPKECFTVLENDFAVYMELKIPERTANGYMTEQYGFVTEDDMHRLSEITGEAVELKDLAKVSTILRTSDHEHKGVLLEWVDEISDFLKSSKDYKMSSAKEQSIHEKTFSIKGYSLEELLNAKVLVKLYKEGHLTITCGPFRPSDYSVIEGGMLYSRYSKVQYHMSTKLNELLNYNGFVKVYLN